MINLSFEEIEKKLSAFNEIIINNFININNKFIILPKVDTDINIKDVLQSYFILCCDPTVQPINLTLPEFEDYLSYQISSRLYNEINKSAIKENNFINGIYFLRSPEIIPYPNAATSKDNIKLTSIYVANPFFQSRGQKEDRITFVMNYVLVKCGEI